MQFCVSSLKTCDVTGHWIHIPCIRIKPYFSIHFNVFIHANLLLANHYYMLLHDIAENWANIGMREQNLFTKVRKHPPYLTQWSVIHESLNNKSRSWLWWLVMHMNFMQADTKVWFGAKTRYVCSMACKIVSFRWTDTKSAHILYGIMGFNMVYYDTCMCLVITLVKSHFVYTLYM